MFLLLSITLELNAQHHESCGPGFEPQGRSRGGAEDDGKAALRTRA